MGESQPKIKPRPRQAARVYSRDISQNLSPMRSITVKAPADFHVHLRQGEFSKLVTPHVREGGFTLAYVMAS